MLKLEAGKRYWRRDGGLSGPLTYEPDVNEAYPFRDGPNSWSENGLFRIGCEHDYDLIREYIDPQPLEWKRGIPTEEECRECWILDGMCESVPCELRTGEVLKPGDTPHEVWLLGSRWYLALRIKPVEPPKPKTATFRKYIEPNGTGEFQMLRDDLDRKSSGWTRTDETMEMEVPA